MKSVTVLAVALLLTGSWLAAADKDDKAAASYIKAEVRGTLRTGLMAAGGETTGTEVTTTDGTVELDFARNRELIARAAKLHGKAVVASGRLRIRPGVERKTRVIVTVTELKEAGQ